MEIVSTGLQVFSLNMENSNAEKHNNITLSVVLVPSRARSADQSDNLVCQQIHCIMKDPEIWVSESS